jgi:hypothetical protein
MGHVDVFQTSLNKISAKQSPSRHILILIKSKNIDKIFEDIFRITRKATAARLCALQTSLTQLGENIAFSPNFKKNAISQRVALCNGVAVER